MDITTRNKVIVRLLNDDKELNTQNNKIKYYRNKMNC